MFFIIEIFTCIIIRNEILKFKQSDWRKKYTDFDKEKRKNTVNSFEKDFLN